MKLQNGWSIKKCQRLSREALEAAIPVRDQGLLYWQSDGKVTLRPFQAEVTARVHELFAQQDVVSAEIYCAGGKTILAATIALPYLEDGKKVIFVSPKRDAFDHFETEFRRVLYPEGEPLDGIPQDAIYARHDVGEFAFPHTEQVYIVTHYDLVDPHATVNERKGIDAALAGAGLVIIDEVHKMPEDNAEETKIIGKVEPIVRTGAMAKGAKVLTLTGTHYRADNKSPFGIREPDITKTCQDLILQGCLPNLYGYPVPISADGLAKVVKETDFLRLKFSRSGRLRYMKEVVKVMLETVEIEAKSCGAMKPCGHAIFVARQEDARCFCKLLNEGLGREAFVAYVSDEIPKEERQDVQERLRDGRLLGYATVMMGAESINVPRLKYAHLVARILSPNKLMQAVGRVMRLPDDSDTELKAVKDKAVVIDYQVRKKKILKLAMGIRDIAKLGGSQVGELPFGGAVFQPRVPAVKLPVPLGLSLMLGDYEKWMTQTGEGPDAEEKKQLFLAMPVGCPRPKSKYHYPRSKRGRR